MFIILNWVDPADILPVMNEDGTAMLFDTHAEAERFAESGLAFNWKIIEL